MNEMYVVYTVEPEYKEWGITDTPDKANNALVLIKKFYGIKGYYSRVE